MKSSMSGDGAHSDARGIGRLLLVVSLAALVVVLYRDGLADMVSLWRLSSYKHGYAIVPVSLYLLWLNRSRLAAEPVQGGIAGLLLCALLATSYVVGEAIAVRLLQHLAMVLMIPALALAVLGWRSFRTVAFALLFLLAAVPAGEELVPLLLEITGEVTALLLRVTGIPFLREGLFFTLPGGSFEIADVCSGVRYLLAGMVTALLFAYLNFATWRKRIAFVLLAAAGFVLANSLRAFLVMAIASWTGGRLLGGRDHIYFGMVLFVTVLVVLLWLGLKYADAVPGTAAIREARSARPDAWARAAVTGVASLIVLALGPWAVTARGDAASATTAVIALPSLTDCSAGASWTAPWKPRMVGAAIESATTYDCGGARAHVYVARYSAQRQGRELAGKANEPIPHAWRRYTVRDVRSLELPGDQTLSVNEATVAQGAEALVIWHWFEVDGQPVRSAAGVKLREALAAFDTTPAPSSIYLVAAASGTEDVEQLRARVAQIASQAWAAGRVHPQAAPNAHGT